MTRENGEAREPGLSDSDWMRRALELAERGRGWVEPNPMVGAVIVRDGRVVGEGWHEVYGGPHAEINALRQAGHLARSATLYVTLEPCCHHGKTPPCTEAVIAAGIKRVVAAMPDPFPQVAGQGLEQLRSAGIEIEVGLHQAEARRLNAPYLTRLEKARPYVHAKWAMTLDGKLATHQGDSRWISGDESRRKVHALRGLMDAIIVGAGTVRADDPLLTVRPPGPRIPTRLVLTRQGDLPPTCRLWQTLDQAPVWLAGPHLAERIRHFPQGVEILSAESIADLLAELACRGFTNVLVEGGAQVLGAFFDARLIDEVHVFVAPKLIGGSGPSALLGLGLPTMTSAIQLQDVCYERSGRDCYIHGLLR